MNSLKVYYIKGGVTPKGATSLCEVEGYAQSEPKARLETHLGSPSRRMSDLIACDGSASLA